MNKPRLVRADTATDLWNKVTRWHLFRTQLDHRSPIACNVNDVFLQARSLDYDFDLREVWLNPSRWTMLIRDYLDPDDLNNFVRGARDIYENRGKTGTLTEMPFRHVQRRAKRHRWGNCLIGTTFRGQADSHLAPTLTFYSRVSYNAYILGLDLAIASVLAREIAGDPSRVRFQWYLNVLSLHPFKSIPYLFTQPDLILTLENPGTGHLAYPTWSEIDKWFQRIVMYEVEGKPLEAEKYGPLKRIRRRYQEYQQGIYVPSTPASSLTFDKLEGYQP